MYKKLNVKLGGIVLSAFFFASGTYGQCITSNELAQKALQIHQEITEPEDRLLQFNVLIGIHKKCNLSLDSSYARMMRYMGIAFYKKGDLFEAIAYTQKAIDIILRRNSLVKEEDLVKCYCNLGIYFDELLFVQEAIDCFIKAESLVKKYPNQAGTLMSLSSRVAYLNFNKGDYSKSIQIAEQGILYAKSQNDPALESTVWIQKSQAELALRQLEKAEASIKKAIQLEQLSKEYGFSFAGARTSFARVLKAKGNFQDALKEYKGGLNYYRKEKFFSDCVNSNIEIGLLYLENLKSPSLADFHFKEALNYAEQSRIPAMKSDASVNFGYSCYQQNRFFLAARYFQNALISSVPGFSDTAITSNPATAKLANINKRQLLLIVENKIDVCLQLYKLTSDKSYLKAAYECCTLGDLVIDKMRYEQKEENTKLYWRQITKHFFESAIELCYLLNSIENGFYFFEKSRAVLLNDQLNERKARSYLSESQVAMEYKLRIHISSLQQQLVSLPDTAKFYQIAIQNLQQKEKELEQLVKGFETKNAGYHQNKYDAAPVSLQQVEQMGESLIEYFSGDTVLYAIAISGKNLVFKKIHYPDYVGDVKQLLRLCSDKSLLNQKYDEYAKLSNKIYRTIFAPLNIPKGRLVISPDEYFIPYDALLTDAKNPTSFLLNDYAISYTYSMQILLKQQKFMSKTAPAFFGLAPVRFNNGLDQVSLSGSGESLTSITSNFSDNKILLNEQASKGNFLANAGNYKMVHLYTHAAADSVQPPIIYFCDSVLLLSELQFLQQSVTELVTLSACKTAVGINAKGEGVFSFARGFAAAGVPSTVSTLWKVDDKATYRFNELFYQFIAKGLAKDMAMQKAKLQLIKENPEYILPYFWAANILIGNNKAISVSTPNKYFYWIMGVLLFVLLLVVLVAKKKLKY
jgi:CHAT domain-containing protein/tetratricopeptide (TPR) repeat protein